MEFRILGPLEVVEGDKTIPLGGGKQRALLAILLLNANQVVSTDRLVDELWGERPPETAAHSVEVYVSQLRKALGREALLTRRPGYLLSVDPDRIDLHRFERLVAEGRRALAAGEPEVAATRLREAHELWRGAPLAEFGFESFAQAAVGRLEELRLAALEERIETELQLGNHAALAGELQALIAEHPLRERLRGQLMLALYRSGRQAEALEAYHEARRVLVDELGIEPSPALQRLEQAILRQDAGLEPAREPVSRHGRPQARAAQRSILVAVRGEGELEALLPLAAPLSRSSSPHELILIRLLESADQLASASAGLEARRAELLEEGTATRVAALTSDDPGSDTVRLASQQDVDLLILAGPSLDLDPHVRLVLENAPCDVALFAGAGEAAADGAVIVPFGGGEHDWSALELGAWLASGHGAPLRLCGPAADPAGRRRDASKLLATASLVVQQLAGVVAEPILGRPGVQSVLEAAEGARAVVIGLSERWRREGVGTARRTIAERAGAPSFLVRQGLRPGGLAPAEGLTRFTWSMGS